jgi:hypothetical protein
MTVLIFLLDLFLILNARKLKKIDSPVIGHWELLLNVRDSMHMNVNKLDCRVIQDLYKLPNGEFKLVEHHLNHTDGTIEREMSPLKQQLAEILLKDAGIIN